MSQNNQPDYSGLTNSPCIPPNITTEESQKTYTIWADTFEKEVIQIGGYTGPQLIRKYACEVFPPSVRSTVRILDIGAGTGLVGQEMKDAGFMHIDGLDPNADMLQKARDRNVYEKYYIEFLTRKELDIPTGSYDGLVGCGCYVDSGHMPIDALYEMVRLVKPGGYIIQGCRTNVLNISHYQGLETLMKQFEVEGRWRLVNRAVEPRFYCGLDGAIWTFQVF